MLGGYIMELIDEFLGVLRKSLDMLHDNDQYLINYEADEPVETDEHVMNYLFHINLVIIWSYLLLNIM